MKSLLAVGKTAISLAICLICSVSAVEANVTLTPTSTLKAQGITSRHFNMVSMSPNNRYICGYTREVKRVNGRQTASNIIYLLPVAANGSLGNVRTYTVDHKSRIEQVCFTPDSNAIVFTTKAGATFMRLDINTGALTTIMEHIPGQPGFRCYPEIILNSQGEMLVQGYFYDGNDYAGRNAIAVLNPNKTGRSAFTLANEIQKAQFSVRRNNKSYTENFPRKDIGFMTIHDEGLSLFYRWSSTNGVKMYDKSKELLGAWGGNTRLLYSTKRLDNTYDLCVYDGATDTKKTIAEGRQTPYLYLFLSADGRTAVFNDYNANQGLTNVYYARESEGWRVTPIKGMNKRVASGAMRISDDGTKLLLHNVDGIRVIDIMGE